MIPLLRLVLSLPSCFSLFLSLVDYPVYPVSDDRVHHHIEDGGGKRVALSDSPRPLERFSVVSSRPCYHGEATPVVCQQPPGAVAAAVAFQDLQAPGPVQSVVQVICVIRMEILTKVVISLLTHILVLFSLLYCPGYLVR